MFRALQKRRCNLRTGIISYQPKVDNETGTIYRQTVRLSRKALMHLRCAVQSEIALNYPRKKEYVHTSEGETFLKDLHATRGVIYMSNTTARFVDLFLKLNLKTDRNTCLVLSEDTKGLI